MRIRSLLALAPAVAAALTFAATAAAESGNTIEFKDGSVVDTTPLTFKEFLEAADPNATIAEVTAKWLEMHPPAQPQTLADKLALEREQELASGLESDKTIAQVAAELLPPDAAGAAPPADASLSDVLALDRQRVLAGQSPWFTTVDDVAAFAAKKQEEKPDTGTPADGSERDPTGAGDHWAGQDRPDDPAPATGNDGGTSGSNTTGGGETQGWNVEDRQNGRTTAEGTHEVTRNADGTTTDVVTKTNEDGSTEKTTTVTDADGNVVSETTETTDKDGNTTTVTTTPDDGSDDDSEFVGADQENAATVPAHLDPSVIAAHNGSFVAHTTSDDSGDSSTGATIFSNSLYNRSGVVDPALPDSDGAGGATIGGFGSIGLHPTATAGPECFDPQGCTTPDASGPVVNPGDHGPIALLP
jgi:hypothetical protein